MSSIKQIEANRRNARTPDAMSQIIAGEDPDSCQELAGTHQILVDRMIVHAWRCRRVMNTEPLVGERRVVPLWGGADFVDQMKPATPSTTTRRASSASSASSPVLRNPTIRPPVPSTIEPAADPPHPDQGEFDFSNPNNTTQPPQTKAEVPAQKPGRNLIFQPLRKAPPETPPPAAGENSFDFSNRPAPRIVIHSEVR